MYRKIVYDTLSMYVLKHRISFPFQIFSLRIRFRNQIATSTFRNFEKVYYTCTCTCMYMPCLHTCTFQLFVCDSIIFDVRMCFPPTALWNLPPPRDLDNRSPSRQATRHPHSPPPSHPHRVTSHTPPCTR